MKLRSLFGRAAWNLLDQVVVSLTNSVLTFVVARSVDEITFGGFSVAFTVFAVLIGISRAAATSPLAVRFSDADGGGNRAAASAALGSALALGIVGGIVLIGIGALLGDVGGEGILALGLVLPGLLVQDAWRQMFFAAGRPAAAAVNSLVWTVVQFAAVAALLVSGMGTVLMLVLAWGGAALVAALVGLGQARTVPRPDRAASWLREHRDLAGYNVADFGVQQGAMQGTLLVLGTLASVAAIGTVRGTLVLLGMTSVLAMATISFALPEIARRRRSFTERQWYLTALGLSALVAGVGVVWGLIFLLSPDAVGRTLLGDSWDGVRAVLLPAIIGQALQAAGLGPSTIVRAMDRAEVTFRRNLVMSPIILVGGVAGTLLAGAAGAFWGFAAAYAIGQPLWWFLVRREVRAFVARGPDTDPAEDDDGREPARRPVPVEPVDPFFADLGTMALPTMQFRAVPPRHPPVVGTRPGRAAAAPGPGTPVVPRSGAHAQVAPRPGAHGPAMPAPGPHGPVMPRPGPPAPVAPRPGPPAPVVPRSGPHGPGMPGPGPATPRVPLPGGARPPFPSPGPAGPPRRGPGRPVGPPAPVHRSAMPPPGSRGGQPSGAPRSTGPVRGDGPAGPPPPARHRGDPPGPPAGPRRPGPALPSSARPGPDGAGPNGAGAPRPAPGPVPRRADPVTGPAGRGAPGNGAPRPGRPGPGAPANGAPANGARGNGARGNGAPANDTARPAPGQHRSDRSAAPPRPGPAEPPPAERTVRSGSVPAPERDTSGEPPPPDRAT